MAGRIESYLHSDNTSSNKGGSLVFVQCMTDFSAITDQFIAFAKKAAKMAYAASANATLVKWSSIIEMFPDFDVEKFELEAKIKEKITVHEATIMNVHDQDPDYKGVGHD
jgi:translation elongation factor EF-Ts